MERSQTGGSIDLEQPVISKTIQIPDAGLAASARWSLTRRTGTQGPGQQGSQMQAPASPVLTTQRSQQKKLTNKPGMGGVAAVARTAVSTAVAVVTADDPKRVFQGDGDPDRKRRGIFYQQRKSDHDEEGGAQLPSNLSRRGDFRQRLDALLAREGQAEVVARHMYKTFEGDASKLAPLFTAMQERWGFPERVFPMLMTLLRRIVGAHSDDFVIGEDEWVQAFVRWLQVQKTRCARTKVTRRRLIQKHTDEDMALAYKSGRRLGEGSYGEVYLATHTKLQVQRVIKSMPKTSLSLGEEQVETEVDTLRSLDHPHIIRIFEAFETEDRLHIVMDFAEGGDLSDAILRASEFKRTVPQAWACECSKQISAALGYMHAKGVIHCDLKPGNVMLLHPFSLEEADAGKAQPHVLVADFGLAEIFQDSDDSGQVKGSPSYLAPEGFEGKLSERSDMWSLGVMMYEMLTGQRPFKGTSNLFTLMCQVQNVDPSWVGIAAKPLEMIVALMAKDPKARPTARECLNYPWLAELTPRCVPPRESGAQDGDLLMQGMGLSSYFHSTVMFCIAAGVGMKDVWSLFEVFRDIDANMDGSLTIEEMTAGLLRNGVRQEAAAMMAILDMDQDGKVGYTEFLSGFLNFEGKRLESALQYAFEVFDLDGDGHLDMHELRVMLSGEGTLADVLPDGKTVEQVMEEISAGDGRISFQDFKAYLEKTQPPPMIRNSLLPPESSQAVGATSHQQLARTSVPSSNNNEEQASIWMADLLEARSGSRVQASMGLEDPQVDGSEKLKEDFPSFNEWLSELYMDAREGASLSKLLTFPTYHQEVTYVAYHLSSSCQQLALLCAALCLYSCWALTTELYGWDPMLALWKENANIACNIAWLWLFGTGVLCIILCLRGVWHPFELNRALNVERTFACWACMVPWVSCFFANRYRVATLFGSSPTDIFESMNSDYDLIVTMLGALMFLTTRTYVRFAWTLPIALSSAAAYSLSSALLGTPYTDFSCGTDRNWAWPALLLISVSSLGLTGHRAIERQRRLTFLSLQASYDVLRELNDGPSGRLEPAQKRCSVAETRTARLKQAVETTRRLCASSEFASKPMKKALESIVEVLEGTKEDLAHADRLLMVDVREVLTDHGVAGIAEDLLLALLDAPQPKKEQVMVQKILSTDFRSESSNWWATKPGGSPSSMLCTTPTNQGAPRVREDWGWDVLAGGISLSVPAGQGELRRALVEKLMPAVELAVSLDRGQGNSKGTEHTATLTRAQQATGELIDRLVGSYSNGPPVAEARAALAVRGAWWISKSLGLWNALPHWDRVALLIAAAGLHCADTLEVVNVCATSRGAGKRMAAIFAPYPLLGAAASVWETLKSLDACGGIAGRQTAKELRHTVRGFMMRARPRCALEDARRVRVAHDLDDQAAWAERQTIASLVVAAADFAFLALPAGPHKRWADACQHEALEVLAGRTQLPVGVQLSVALQPHPADNTGREMAYVFDTSAWLRGLIQALALPVYETLANLDNSEMEEGPDISDNSLDAPISHLRKNAKHWKVNSLLAHQKFHEHMPSAVASTTSSAGGASGGRSPGGSRILVEDEEEVLNEALRSAALGVESTEPPKVGKGSNFTGQRPPRLDIIDTDAPPINGRNSSQLTPEPEDRPSIKSTATAPPEVAAASAAHHSEGSTKDALSATLPGADIAEALQLSDVPPPGVPDPTEGIISAEEGAAELLLGELMARDDESVCTGMEIARQDSVQTVPDKPQATTYIVKRQSTINPTLEEESSGDKAALGSTFPADTLGDSCCPTEALLAEVVHEAETDAPSVVLPGMVDHTGFPSGGHAGKTKPSSIVERSFGNVDEWV